MAWPINVPVETHVQVVPELLRWTQWQAMDSAWLDMRRDLVVADGGAVGDTGGGANAPRHLRLAYILDFVGTRASAEGRPFEECLALCRQASTRSAMGQLEVTTDPETGAIVDVSF